jgi:hypothetical protein
MAGPTRLELATSGVTGRRSNQLNYDPVFVLTMKALDLTQYRTGAPSLRPRLTTSRQVTFRLEWWAVQGSNLWQPACKASALPLS